MTTTIATHPQVSAVILAAGKGTRMGSDLAKVLHPLAGRALLEHVLDTCARLHVGQTVVVVGWQREQVSQLATTRGAECAIQDQQLGTGHAVLSAMPQVKGTTVLVLCGDCPLTPPEVLDRLLTRHAQRGAACTAVAARMTDPTGYGRMITDSRGFLQRIVEHRDATPEQRKINLVNSGIYAFSAKALADCLQRLRPENAQKEYYLTDAVAMLVAAGHTVDLEITDKAAHVLGVNTPQDLAQAEAYLNPVV